MENQVQTFGLRLPVQMRIWIGSRAKRNSRSINSEIIHLLSAVQLSEGGEHGKS